MAVYYDDEMKLFLMKALRKVDYLADLNDEILTNLAFSCSGEIKEKGSLIYDMELDPKKQIRDEMLIIFDG